MVRRRGPPRSLEGGKLFLGGDLYKREGESAGEGEGETWGLGTKGGKQSVSYHGWSLLLDAETREDQLLKTLSSCHLAPTSMTPHPSACRDSRMTFWIHIDNFYSTQVNQFSQSDVLPTSLTSGWKDPPRVPSLLSHL